MKNTFSPILALLVLGAVCLFSACAPVPEGTRHPLFIKAVKLKKQERFQEAAETFEKCLRQSPGNRPAHVHLGMLYEDHLDDPITALYHYQQAAGNGAEDAHAQFARHAADALLERLIARHLEATPADTAEPPPEAEGNGIDELKAQVRELTRQRVFLLSQLKAAATRLQAAETELNTSRAGQTAPGPETDRVAPVTSYQVKKGDTLIGIARKHYGSSTYWQALRDYNHSELRGGDRVIPGMTLRMPPLDDLKRL